MKRTAARRYFESYGRSIASRGLRIPAAVHEYLPGWAVTAILIGQWDQSTENAVKRARRNTEAVGDAVRSAFDISCFIPIVVQEISVAAGEHARPSVLFRPELTVDGNKCCALYGVNLMEGIAGFGDTAELAMRDFDKNWRELNSPTAAREVLKK